MEISEKISIKIMTCMLNHEELQNILIDELHMTPLFLVTEDDVEKTFNGQMKDHLTATEIIAAAKVLCAVMGKICPIVNGL